MRKVKILNSKIVYKGDWLTLKKDKIIKPDGSEATHEVLLRNNGIIVIPIINKNFVITRMYRYPVDSYSFEFPMGFIKRDEKPSHAAKRELEEETGYFPGKLTFLGKLWAWSGLMNQTIFVYAAEDLKFREKHLDKTERDLTTKLVSREKLDLLIKMNKIKNSASLAAYQIWNSHYEKNKP